ncbi:MAG: acyl-CoA carboxylase subunit beta [Bacteroidales bacterium]|nr:acyl-CoA carboxylase subunit beta [Bacteroidales bacterium]
MKRLSTTINIQSEEFKASSERYRGLVKEYRQIYREIMKGGTETAVKKHLSRNKLLVRQRINKLLDVDTPFLELSPLAANDQYQNAFPSAGIITGIGLIHGKETVIIGNDATVKGGTYVKETIKKHLRAQEIAMENNLPVVYLVDSGGIYLPEQANVFPDKYDFGRIFFNQAKLSAMGIPQVSIVMGSCTAGGAYIPAMSDQTVIVKNQGTIFLGGPPLVKAATGEEVTSEELGGGFVHTTKSGVADYLALNDEHALQQCRDIFETIPAARKQHLDFFPVREPEYNIEELYGILPLNAKSTVDPREIIMRIADGSEFDEFKAGYATTLVTGFARIMGFPLGIIANNGILFSESALKGTHFIELCNRRNIPILFLQNITGFMVGKEFENAGIAKDGAKMVQAVANANVPKFTIIFGGSYGAGNYAMSGRAFGSRLLFMYPASSISVMGGEQAANVLDNVGNVNSRDNVPDLKAGHDNRIKQEILEKYQKEGSAYYSTSRLWDDGIIDPADTRTIIAMGLSMSLNRKFDEPKTGIYRM